jgi:predicted phosphohydrolase
MKLFAISDLHLNSTTNKPMDIFGDQWVGHFDKIKQDWEAKVTDDDIVLIAGDISWAMTLDNAMPDLEKIAALKGEKFIIRGNHDYWWSSYNKILNKAPKSLHFLQNNALKIDKFIICGTRGWTVAEDENNISGEDKKIFNREIIRLKLSIDSAKSLYNEGDTIIAMMHFPPFNSTFEDNAFTTLFDTNDISTVIYGHLHGNKSRFQLKVNKKNTNYFLTSCDLLNNKLIQIF